jgi:uncharacterized protein (DUF885 family)
MTTYRLLTPRAAFAAFAALAALGCTKSKTEPSRSTTSETAAPVGAPSASTAASSSLAFDTLRTQLLNEWLADSPSWGREVGLHEYDGKVADYSAAAVAARVERLQRASTSLAAIDASRLAPDDALDLSLLKSYAEHVLFRLVDMDEAKTKPQFYDELFSVNSYIDRDYLPKEERARRLVAHEEAALAQTAHVRKNLAANLSKPVVETAAKIFKGYATYLRSDVVEALKGVGDAAFQERFTRVNTALAGEAEKLATTLSSEYLPAANDSHVLGEARYRKLLHAQEGLDTPLAEFKRIGEADLARNRAAYEALEPTVKITRPKATELLPTATKLMDEARSYIVAKDIIGLASDDRALVKESPPYMRWNAAFLDASGPFDTARSAYYYITLPDPKWPKAERDGYIPDRGSLRATTVHEVYPGHFLQGRWVDRAPTRAQKMIGSYSFIEGWAHYVEEMMLEQGFGADDPEAKLGQLGDALLRNCRFVVSIGVHTEGMTLDKAAQRFVEECHQDKATALEQVVRATFDPGYFAYTLGKMQIMGLREDARKALGPSFSLRRFHDALLSHGSPPVALIRERVLKDIGASRAAPGASSAAASAATAAPALTPNPTSIRGMGNAAGGAAGK